MLLLLALTQLSATAQPYHFSQRRSSKLDQKLVDLDNSVYDLLDLYETTGLLGFLPLSRPYSKGEIKGYLQELLSNKKLTRTEKQVITNYIFDLSQSVSGFIAHESKSKNAYTVVGAAATLGGRTGMGESGTWATSNIMKPFIAGDLGSNLSYFTGMEFSIDRMAVDLFHESYVKDGAVQFPSEPVGYAWHPYQFEYTTMWAYIDITGKADESLPIQNNLTAGMTYLSELSGSWFNDALRLNVHNNQRSWGFTNNNLILSAQARRFTGIDLTVRPIKTITYSMLVGSLYSYARDQSAYKKQIYGYDLGAVQKMYTLQMIEYSPVRFLQIMLSAGNIWKKRMEMSYIMPFTIPYLTQVDNGEHDNLSISANLSLLFPTFGKTWVSLFIDELEFTETRQLVSIPKNQLAWQWGWRSSMLSNWISGTSWLLSATRVAPFVYTHTPQYQDNVTSSRPWDMTYTHDGTCLGFYLPPNSAELKFKLINMGIANLKIELDNRYIIHGTNDLSGDSLQIFGDINRYQAAAERHYPAANFMNDGIYDYTLYSQLRIEYRVRKGEALEYYRVYGTVGYSNTRWESNLSGVIAPDDKKLYTLSLGMSIDM